MPTMAASSTASISSNDMAQLRNRFVTGDWGEGKKRSLARPKKREVRERACAGVRLPVQVCLYS